MELFSRHLIRMTNSLECANCVYIVYAIAIANIVKIEKKKCQTKDECTTANAEFLSCQRGRHRKRSVLKTTKFCLGENVQNIFFFVDISIDVVSLLFWYHEWADCELAHASQNWQPNRLCQYMWSEILGGNGHPRRCLAYLCYLKLCNRCDIFVFCHFLFLLVFVFVMLWLYVVWLFPFSL